MLRHVPGHLKTKKMCEGAIEEEPWGLCIELHSLAYVLDQYKTQEMCNKAVRINPWSLRHVPDQYKTHEI